MPLIPSSWDLVSPLNVDQPQRSLHRHSGLFAGTVKICPVKRRLAAHMSLLRDKCQGFLSLSVSWAWTTRRYVCINIPPTFLTTVRLQIKTNIFRVSYPDWVCIKSKWSPASVIYMPSTAQPVPDQKQFLSWHASVIEKERKGEEGIQRLDLSKTELWSSSYWAICLEKRGNPQWLQPGGDTGNPQEGSTTGRKKK